MGCEEHPIIPEESANQSEGCDAKLQGPERAASCTFKNRTAPQGAAPQQAVPQSTKRRALCQPKGWCGALLFCGMLGFIFWEYQTKEENFMKPKRLISLLLAVCMVIAILPVSAFAAENSTSGPCGDNATWALTEDNNGDYTLTISGTGAMTDYSAKGDAPWFWANKQIRES